MPVTIDDYPIEEDDDAQAAHWPRCLYCKVSMPTGLDDFCSRSCKRDYRAHYDGDDDSVRMENSPND